MLHHDMSHDNPDFLPLLQQTNSIVLVDIVLSDMGFDDENNHVVGGAKQMNVSAVIPTRCVGVPMWRTGGCYLSQRDEEKLSHFIVSPTK